MEDLWRPLSPPPSGLVVPVRRRVEATTEPAGRPTRGQVPGPRWRTVAHGWHVPGDTPVTPEQRILEASVRLPPEGMVTGWGSLRLAGGGYFDGLAPDGATPLDVPVLLPHARRIRSSGLLVTRTRRPLPLPVERYGVRCAPTDVATVHAMHTATDEREAVVALSMALAADLTTLDDVAALLGPTHRRGCSCVWALEHADGDAASPPEMRMCLTWQHDAGHPRPLLNREVLDGAGRRLAVVDLLDVEAGVVGEYNGAAHRSRSRHRRDEARADSLRGVGLETFTVVAGDETATQVARMQAARRRALWLPAAQRRWRVGGVVRAIDLQRREEARGSGVADSPVPGLDDADLAAYEAWMVEHHRGHETDGRR